MKRRMGSQGFLRLALIAIGVATVTVPGYSHWSYYTRSNNRGTARYERTCGFWPERSIVLCTTN